ncbi:sigma-70 family RNA polymerase sigma factor [bacterium]|nr:sigma-70 family RNA polymerase sigma factor [bacterium]
MRVFPHAHSYDPARGKATTWATAVCRSAVNRIVEDRRRQARTLGNSRGTDSALELHPDSRLPPDEQVEAADNAVAVQELLGGLDPHLARAVALRFGIGEAGEVVGEELGRRLGVSRSAAFEMVKAGLNAIRGKTALLTW